MDAIIRILDCLSDVRAARGNHRHPNRQERERSSSVMPAKLIESRGVRTGEILQMMGVSI